jgi:hypothetical protein
VVAVSFPIEKSGSLLTEKFKRHLAIQETQIKTDLKPLWKRIDQTG